MRKFLLMLLICAALTPASKPLLIEICRHGFCYQQAVENARSYTVRKMENGTTLIRVLLWNGNEVDFSGTDIKVVQPKRKRK
jgi:hypothetical protein